MRVYRVSRHEFSHDLSGFGASMVGGRWNHPGEYLLYTAETSSLSILESLVHLNGATVDLEYDLITIDLQDSSILSLEDLKLSLKPDWADLDNITDTRQIGSDWIESKASSILQVPSVLNPLELNYLLNPRHKDLKVSIVDSTWFFFNGRLRSAK